MSVDFLSNAHFSEQVISVLATYDSTSTTSGSLLTQGGLGVKLSAHVGEQLYVNSVNVTPSLGDIVYEREQHISNDVSNPASISDFVFYNDITQTFKSVVSVSVENLSNSNLNKNAVYTLAGNLKANTWTLNSSYTGDITGVKFFINNTSIGPRAAGQITYTNSNSTGTSTTIRFKANTISPTGSLNDSSPYASLPITLESTSVDFTVTNASDWNTNPTSVQDAVDELASRVKNINFANEYHVSKGGNDSTGNGSIESPYLTIQAAIDQSNSLPISTSVVIYIHPGIYTENITITKPKTSLVGTTSTLSNASQINGNITITPSDDSLGVFNTIYSLENLLVTGRSGSSSTITFSGTETGYLYIKDCKIYTSIASQKLLYYTNTNATNPRFRVTDCSFISTTGTDSLYEVASGSATIGTFSNVEFGGNTSTPIVIRGSSTSNIFNSCDIQATSPYLVDVIAATLVSISNSSLVNASLNSSGINMSSTAIVTLFGCIISIPTNSSYPTNLTPPSSTVGYAVRGVSGSAFTYGSITFVPLANISGTYYWTTNKISSAVTITPSTFAFVAQA